MWISQEEYQRIKDIKELDIEVCEFGHLNILNLGWEVWGKWFCSKHEKEHVLCRELCLPVSKNIGCELTKYFARYYCAICSLNPKKSIGYS